MPSSSCSEPSSRKSYSSSRSSRSSSRAAPGSSEEGSLESEASSLHKKEPPSSVEESSEASSEEADKLKQPKLELRRVCVKYESDETHLANCEGCDRCTFLRDPHKYERLCCWTCPVTGTVYTWLIQSDGAKDGTSEWALGCMICRWAKSRTKFGLCKAKSLQVVARHNHASTHKSALVDWLAFRHKRYTVNDGSGSSEVIKGPPKCGIGYGHILKMLELFENNLSLRSFSRIMDSGRRGCGDLNPGNDSRTVASQLLRCQAAYERKGITKPLLKSASYVAIAQDAMEQFFVVNSRMVLWKLPPKFKKCLPDGVVSILGDDAPPWIANRAFGVTLLGSDRSANASAEASVRVMETCVGPETLKAEADKFRMFSADNASEETIAGEKLKDVFGKLDFDVPDTTHSLMLAIKNGCAGDDELDIIQGILVTNKKPVPSIANMLRSSHRFRKSFAEEQQNGVMVTLEHLGYAPQRHVSRKRTYTRGSLKLEDVLSAVAREVEGGTYHKAAEHNLLQISKYNRLMMAGMMGDLMHEHQITVRQSDASDPEPTAFQAQVAQFERRANMLFHEGHCMSMQYSYTQQVLKFLRKPSVIFANKHAILFARPHKDDKELIFEPLERMRAILGNILACLRASLPSTAWQYQFTAFYLPSPLAPDSKALQSSKNIYRSRLLQIFQQAKVDDPEAHLAELLDILPLAQRFRAHGLTHRQAWAKASREYPEKARARVGVNLLLAFLGRTGNTERFLKRVRSRSSISQDKRMEDFFICDAHAPKPHVAADLPATGSLQIVPKSDYMPSVLLAYQTCYGGRNYKKRPKLRRDSGVKHSEERLAKKPKINGKVTEAAFQRKREAEMKKLLADRSRGQAEGKYCGEVPQDTGRYVTDHVQSVRDQAKQRQARKEKGVTEERMLRLRKKTERQKKIHSLRRWIGKAPRGAQSPTPLVSDVAAPEPYALLAMRDPKFDASKWPVLGDARVNTRWFSNWTSLAKVILQVPRARYRVLIVGPDIVGPDTWTKQTLPLCCRIFGGYLTSTAWMNRSIDSKAAPQGVFFGGLTQKKGLKIYLSPKCLKDAPHFTEMLKVLDKADILDRYASLTELFGLYRANSGGKRRPWTRIRALGFDDSDAQGLLQTCKATSVEARFATSLSDFLAQYSPHDRNIACPGKPFFCTPR